MSQVSSTGATAASNNSVNPENGLNELNVDDFLELLITEMQNQDPTKPMESTEYVAQLASFSNVEQAIQTNEKLDALLGSSFIASAGSLIGRTITSADGSISGEIVQVKVVRNLLNPLVGV